MSKTLPKTLRGSHRNSFALIDPSTELFYRKLDRHGWLGTSQHIAISYVWSEWVDDPTMGMPNWNLIRERLRFILGEAASKAIQLETGGATRCWLDSKCIDQTSQSNKSYWIPRMDEVYAEAKCTILLLKEPSASVVASVAQRMKCDIKNKATVFDWPHNCLLTQSCTTLPEMSTDQETACIRALRNLYDGAWRKRAWIFQEILLSKRYLLSSQESEFIELGDVGVITNLLFQRHLEETWLGNFSDWCRRLFYLRQFYAQSRLHHLSDANVFQMATGLQATVPADKIYALCGILGLKHVRYNKLHTADEAFQVVVGELVKRGRLSWLYAIPPSLNNEDCRLVQGGLTPFVLTRLSDKIITNRDKSNFTNESVTIPVMCLGQVVRAKSLADLLQETRDWMKQNSSKEFPPELEYMLFTPKIIRRIALDVINPLLIDPLFGQICHGLGISKESGSRPTRAWRMITLLWMKDLALQTPQADTASNREDDVSAMLAWSAARSLQERLKLLQREFSVIWWRSDESDALESLGLGPQTCSPGNYICSMKDDEQILVAASFQPPARSASTASLQTVGARFRGSIYDLNSTQTIQWRVKVGMFYVLLSPLDMQGPVFGDHPFWDDFKDDRYDKYIRTDASRTETRAVLLSRFAKVRNQKGRPLCLKFAYSGIPRVQNVGLEEAENI